ncbi:MAG TPA: hypothetical protein VEI82_05235 [Myxococcota bacterium]|nr:hypothetical protein [Myxococcota bacterium]
MRIHPRRSALAAVLLATACASFSARPKPPEYAGPLHPLPVRLSVTERSLVESDDHRWADQSGNGALASSALKAILSSGWIDEKRYDMSSALLDVRISNYQSQGPSLATVFTGCLVPGILDHRITVDASLSPATGAVERCSRAVEIRTWYQTFLILAYPFAAPRSVRSDAASALALQCVAELLQHTGSTAAR